MPFDYINLSMHPVTQTNTQTNAALHEIGQAHLPLVNAETIEEELRIQYDMYRQNQLQRPFLKRTCSALGKLSVKVIGFVHQFWREIVPEVIRGHMATFTTSVSSAATEREVNHFSEFMKKRTPFFLIVFKNDCSEEEEQQAYISATNITPEGLSLKEDEMISGTSYRHWSIPNIENTEKYSIHVLKFDLFQKTTWFGTLTRSMLINNTLYPQFLEDFKRRIDSSIKQYQRVENSFLGSYVEKEDRFALDPQQQK